MNTRKISCALAIMALLSVSLNVNAQRQNRIVSPEINENNTVTFRLHAPGVNSIKLSGSWMQGWGARVDMVKEDTLWTYTTEVLAPELYTYAFYIDRAKVLDPSNVRMVRDGSRYESMLIVPGKESDIYEVHDVPHGTISKVWYPSPTLDMKRRMYVYTPPGYEDGTEQYPVFYLLHGAGGDEDAWTTLGRTPYIMDNLIAGGKAKPMIVVMTNGNAWSAAAPGEEPARENENPPDFSGMVRGDFEKSLVNDVIPYIEEHYRTLKGKDNRAIAGLSMGGMQTQTITNTNPGKFSYIGVMSMGLMNNPRWGDYDEEEHKKQIKTLQDSGVKLYWIGCGKEDFLFENVTNLRKFYDDLGFEYEYMETPGGHTWANWRIYLTELAPKLFK
jgi:enterochelin esterase-like enzyme